jgi:hypothetical protein
VVLSERSAFVTKEEFQKLLMLWWLTPRPPENMKQILRKELPEHEAALGPGMVDFIKRLLA